MRGNWEKEKKIEIPSSILGKRFYYVKIIKSWKTNQDLGLNEGEVKQAGNEGGSFFLGDCCSCL